MTLTWIETRKLLPPEGIYVLIKHNKTNWIDSSDQDGVQFDVAKRIPAQIAGNNLVPYEYDTFGPTHYFGQEITHWAYFGRI